MEKGEVDEAEVYGSVEGAFEEWEEGKNSFCLRKVKGVRT